MSIHDNISGDSLATALKKMLGKARRADFCIGYFNLRGWDLLHESVDARHLHKRGGMMIGDVVRLWNDYKPEYGLRAEVMSLGEVRNKLKTTRPFRIVIIDESHNLRNREGRRYCAIREYLYSQST
jgi:hypothetical protein